MSKIDNLAAGQGTQCDVCTIIAWVAPAVNARGEGKHAGTWGPVSLTYGFQNKKSPET